MSAERDIMLLLIGALGFIVLSHQIPALRTLDKTVPEKLEDVKRELF